MFFLFRRRRHRHPAPAGKPLARRSVAEDNMFTHQEPYDQEEETSVPEEDAIPLVNDAGVHHDLERRESSLTNEQL